MTTNETIANHNDLRTMFRTMDADTAQQIRDAYYKAVEGLQSLADALEMADANMPSPASGLMTEHLTACEAIEAMNKSQLGRIL